MSLSFKAVCSPIKFNKITHHLLGVIFMFSSTNNVYSYELNPLISRINQKENIDISNCSNSTDRFDPVFLLSKRSEVSVLAYNDCNKKTTDKVNDVNSIYNIVKVPDGGPEWVSIIISMLALLASIGIPGYQFWRQRKSSVNEGFWLREVIFPKLNEITFSVINTFKQSLDLNLPDFAIAYGRDLIPALNQLRDASSLMNSFPKNEDFVTRMETICDSFENEVDNNQSKSKEIRLTDINDFHNKVISLFIEYHFKNL
ncbi:hypothetical protein AAF463_23925 (plasmid) [Pantoea sp. BJ2]|uniref:DUF4381 domain-containing protein n=1 Tax=Pantoea sp. BJ2 TaxID=3141322 RepID=A0AAU7U3Z1_9GAMM